MLRIVSGRVAALTLLGLTGCAVPPYAIGEDAASGGAAIDPADADDATIVDVGPVSDTADTAAAPKCASDLECASGRWCRSDGVCAPGCRNDGECAVPGGGTTGVRCDLEKHVCRGCAKDDECSSEYRCAIAPGAARGDCVVRTDLVCDGDHVVTAKDGASTDCSPYRCDVEGCKRNCDVSSDCVVGFLCERESRTCVAAPIGDASDAGGCHASRGPARDVTTLLLALPAAFALIARRRRRA